MPLRHALHQSSQLSPAGRREQQVDVVPHQDIGVRHAALARGQLGEVGEVASPIPVGEASSARSAR
jgi:hypothetical protein